MRGPCTVVGCHVTGGCARFVTDPNPAKKPIEEAPKTTRCPVPEDSAAVNVVVVVDQCCLVCLPAGMHLDSSAGFDPGWGASWHKC